MCSRLVTFKQTGEIIEAASTLSFNEETLAEEEKYDGYYVIVTSRHQETDDWIISTYKELWRIEETFRVTKSELEARPVYVSREDHIQAHFLTCFVALVIVRLLQNKVSKKYSARRILESLSKTCCSNIHENLFVFDYFDEVIESIGEISGIDYGKKFRTRAEIKNIVAQTKKH
jgi:transposase